MSFIASVIDGLFPTRTGTYGCVCGAVQFSLSTPGSSYGWIEQTNALCHCRDCLGFVKACNTPASIKVNNATHMAQFYKSDVKVVSGKEHIGSCKLKEQSPMIRCYCKKCGTPLGMDMCFGPVTLLYISLLRDYSVVFLPSMVLNYGSAVDGTKPYDRHAVVRKGMLAPVFLLRVIARIIVGALFGKGRQGGLLVDCDYDAVPVGIDKIVFDNKTK